MNGREGDCGRLCKKKKVIVEEGDKRRQESKRTKREREKERKRKKEKGGLIWKWDMKGGMEQVREEGTGDHPIPCSTSSVCIRDQETRQTRQRERQVRRAGGIPGG